MVSGGHCQPAGGRSSGGTDEINVEYKVNTKAETEREYPGSKGYAIGFEGLIEFIKRLLPASEVLRVLRTERTVILKLHFEKL